MLPPFPVLFPTNTPRWAQGADIATDYTIGRDYFPLKGMFPPGVDTHAQSQNANTPSNVYQSFAANVPVITGLGLQTSPTATQLLTSPRDFTNAAWVKTTMTAALTSVGIDGATNSASRLTSTAGLGTALQTVVGAAVSRTFSLFVKRVTGVGTVEITHDGTTWTDITALLSTGSFYRGAISATQLNPVVGIRLTTNGDAVDVDVGQLQTGAFATPPIYTTTTVNGNQQVVSGLGTQLATGVAGLIQSNFLQAPQDFRRVIAFTDGTTSNYVTLYSSGGSLTMFVANGGVVSGAVVVGTMPTGIATIAFAASTNYAMARIVGMSAPSPDTTVTWPTISQVAFNGLGVNAAENYYAYARKAAFDFLTPSDDPSTKFAYWFAQAQLAAAA